MMKCYKEDLCLDAYAGKCDTCENCLEKKHYYEPVKDFKERREKALRQNTKEKNQ